MHLSFYTLISFQCHIFYRFLFHLVFLKLCLKHAWNLPAKFHPRYGKFNLRNFNFDGRKLFWYTVKPVNSKLFEKQQKVYYCQEFTIEKVIYVINWLKSSQKKFTIDPLFTIDRFTIGRVDCTLNSNSKWTQIKNSVIFWPRTPPCLF